jgi:hypothetical protein
MSDCRMTKPKRRPSFKRITTPVGQAPPLNQRTGILGSDCQRAFDRRRGELHAQDVRSRSQWRFHR